MAHGVTRDERNRSVLAVTLPVIALILVGWALKATYFVTMPLAFAFFLAVLVYPIKRWVEEHVPERVSWLGIVAAMTSVLAVIGVFCVLVWLSVEIVGDKAPQYAEQLRGYWESITRWARQHNLPLPETPAQGGGDGGGGLIGRITGLAATAVWSFWEALAILVLIFFYTLLMLAETSAWRRKSHTAFAGGRAREVVETVNIVAEKVRRYLLALTAISLISGVLAWLWLLVLGVDFAFVWGLVTFLLNYIPNVGSVIAVLLATLFVLLQLGWFWALIAFLGRLVTEQVIGNYLQPIIEGRILNISPLVVLVAVIFWGWVWGAPGALLAVPLTATIIIICAQVEPLKPIAVLLSHSGDERILTEQNRAAR